MRAAEIDEVLLAETAICLNAGLHRFWKRGGDAGVVARQDLFAAEVTAIGNGFELVDAENGLRLLRGSTGSRFSQRHNVNRQICDVCSR